MSDQITIEGLRDLLNQHKPVPFMPRNIDGTVMDMWHVLDNLLTLVEEQTKEIKALKDAIQGDGK